MEEELKLPEEKKEQLLHRVKEALENDILNKLDWFRMYDILIEACHRETMDAQERYLIESISGECDEDD